MTLAATMFVPGTTAASVIGMQTTSPRHPVVIYRADPGEVNRVTVSNAANGFVQITDPGAKFRHFTLPPSCTISGSSATCPTLFPATVNVFLEDRDDTISLDNYDDTYVQGGSGDDRVLTSGARHCPWFFGGSGNDTVHDVYCVIFHGNAGNDVLTSEPGSSGNVLGGGGADTAYGPGILLWDYIDHTAGVTVTPDGVADDGSPGEGDNVPPTARSIRGSPGDDDLTATSADPASVYGVELWGLAGNDTLRGGPAADVLFANQGNDLILAHGGGSDYVECAAGTDSAFLDALDRLAQNSGCEQVNVSP